MKYKYELHAHTSKGSKCSIVPPKEMVDFYKSMGFYAIGITDHFTGNTTVPKDTPWPERVDEFFLPAYEAIEYGKQVGLKVYLGLEYSDGGNDFLFYNLDPKVMRTWTDFFDLPLRAKMDRVHENGGLIIHAHPFAEERWIPFIKLLPRSVDAVEVINGGGGKFMNDMANIYAEYYGLCKTAGTDTHRTDIKRLTYVECDKPCDTFADLMEEIRAGRTNIVDKTLE